jgi:hypothetical protein
MTGIFDLDNYGFRERANYIYTYKIITALEQEIIKLLRDRHEHYSTDDNEKELSEYMSFFLTKQRSREKKLDERGDIS